MRNRVSAFSARMLGQVALVAVLAGFTAACSGSKRLSDTFFTGSTDNQRQIIGQNTGDAGYQPMPAAVASNDTITRNELPPPADYTPSYAAVSSPGTIPESAYAPPPAPIAEPATLAASGGTYIVQPGDTLFGIARSNGTTVANLVAINGLASPDAIRLGQTLKIDGTGAMQPRTTTVAALGEPEKPLGQLRVTSDGQEVALGAPAPAAPPQPVQQQAALEPPKPPTMPTIPAETSAQAVPASVTASIDEAADEASSDGKQFRWPVRGRIISGFGTKPNGEKNDGINLAVPEGTSVKAAETGTVIYAGNELEGYGNLVLVRHADGWVTAYAHNKEMLVKRGDQVKRGQTVAYAGMSGSVSSPQVHFELRKGAKPVNPLDYLAGT